MSEDLIKRSDAIETAYQLRHKPNDAEWTEWLKSFDAIPSPEPKTGEWIQKDMYADRFCSKCNYAVWDSEAEEYNFCPNCGAKMYKDGEDE